MKSGFFDPNNPEYEFAHWNDMVDKLGADRALALIEHGNALDLWVAGLSWISKPRQRTVYSWDPIFQTLQEKGWECVKRWLQFDEPWHYAGSLAPKAAE